MLSLLLAATLSAAPRYIEPWGLSLAVKEDALVIDAVRPGSLAEKSKLEVGAVLLRIAAPPPTQPGALGTLDGAALEAVRAELAETKAERVTLEFAGEQETRRRALDRNPFVPKTADELRKMSPMEQGLYYGQMGQRMRPASSGSLTGVHFGSTRVDREAFVDPATHSLLGVPGGGATGAWVLVSAQLHYTCTSTAVAATLRGQGLPAPVQVDLSADRLQGGVQPVLLPVAKLGDVAKCPREPLAQRFELELQCSEGPKVLGRETVRLFVKCEAPKGFVMSPFSRQEPMLDGTTVAEGTASVLVRPYLDREGPMPRAVDVLVLDAQGTKVSSLPAAWRGDGAKTTDAWQPVRVPVPAKTGSYQVVYEASWADGSSSRSATARLTVLGKAEAEQRDRDFAEGSKNMLAVQARMKREGINPCDSGRAMAWLKKQPEVDSVMPHDSGDYSWAAKKAVSPVSVHCHGGY